MAAPTFDIDGNGRPALGGYDSGADEFGTSTPPPPALAFPATSILDDFNRGGTGNSTLGGNWSGALSQIQLSYRINTFLIEREVQVRTVGGGGLIYWNPTAFGANQEAYFTFTDISTVADEQDLILKRSGTLLNPAMIEVLYDHNNSRVEVHTRDSVNGWVLRATFNSVGFANGDQFGARTQQDGTVTVYKNGVVIGTTNVSSGVNPWPTTLAQGGGQIGVWFVNTSGTSAGDAHSTTLVAAICPNQSVTAGGDASA